MGGLPRAWGEGIRKHFGTAENAGVSEWQTMRTQNPLVATPCGFKSHHRHHVRTITLIQWVSRQSSLLFA